MWLANDCHSSASGLDYGTGSLRSWRSQVPPSTICTLTLTLLACLLPILHGPHSLVTCSLGLHKTLTLTWVGGNPGQVT